MIPEYPAISPSKAPEVLKNEGNYKGDAADIWSCGVMLYVMLFGRYPFDAPPPPGGNGQDMRSRQLTPLILAGKWAAPPDIPISPQCHDLLKQLLVPDPERRLKMDQVGNGER
jgi:serine/threonine-protein kinase SRK2